MCDKYQSECQLAHDRIYGLIGILMSSQRGLIMPDYSKSLAEIYIDVLVSLFLLDTAADWGYIQSWGNRGNDLLASARTIQRLLEHPLWNDKALAFHPVRKICNTLQLTEMKELRRAVWIEGAAAISELGDVLTLEQFLTCDLPNLAQADTVRREKFRIAAKNLRPGDVHSTQAIGTLYTKSSTSPRSDPFNAIEDVDARTQLVSHESTGKIRIFRTGNGLLGLASESVRKGDLLYGFCALEKLFLRTDDLYLIIRPNATSSSVHSFTLIGRAIMLPVPKEKYSTLYGLDGKEKFSNFGFKDDLIAEGVDIAYDTFQAINCSMDGITLFLLTR